MQEISKQQLLNLSASLDHQRDQLQDLLKQVDASKSAVDFLIQIERPIVVCDCGQCDHCRPYLFHNLGLNNLTPWRQ